MTTAELKNRLSLLERQTEDLRSRIDQLLKKTETGVLLVQGQKILDCNARAMDMLGITKNQIKRASLQRSIRLLAVEDQNGQLSLDEVLMKAKGGKEQEMTALLHSVKKDPVLVTLFVKVLRKEDDLIQILMQENRTLSAGTDRVPGKNFDPGKSLDEKRISVNPESLSRLCDVFNVLPDGLFMQEIETGKVVDINQSLLTMFNGTREDIVGKVPDDLSLGISPYDKDHAVQYFRRAVIEGESVFEWNARKLTGEYFWIEMHHKRVIVNGEMLILTTVRDISASKKIEAELRLSENRFRSFADCTTDGIYYLTINPPMDLSLSTEEKMNYFFKAAYFSEVNDAFLKINRIQNKENVIGQPVRLLYDPEIIPDELMEMLHKFFSSGYQISNTESTFKRDDGSCNYYLNSATSVIHDRKLAGIWNTMRDITERKGAEQALNYKTSLDQLISRLSTRFINLPLHSIDKKIESSLGEFCRFTRSDAGFLSLVSFPKDTFSITHLWQNKKISLPLKELVDIPTSKLNRVLREFEKEDILHLTSKEEWSRLLGPDWLKSPSGLQSSIIRPVYFREKLVGVIGLLSATPFFTWNKDDFLALKVISEIFINALERKKTEKALSQSEQNYREIFNSAHEAFVIYDTVTDQIMDVSRSFYSIFGLTSKDINQYSMMDLIANKSGPSGKIVQEVKKRLEHEDYAMTEIYTQRINMERLWIEVSAKNVTIGGEKRILAVVRDISDRKEAQEALMKSEERFRSILQHLTDIILIINADMKITYESPSASKVMGYKPGFLINKKGLDFVHPDDLPLVLNALKKVFQKTSGFIPTGFRARHADGHYLYMEALANNMLDHKAIQGIIITCRDVSERIESERQLRESEEKFRSIFETAMDGIFMMQGDRFVDCNSAVLKLFGVSREQILGRPPYFYSPEIQPDGRNSKESAAEKINAAYAGYQQFFEWRHSRSDGSTFDTEVTLHRIELGGTFYLQAIVRDITSRKAAEKAIIESEAKFRNIFNSTSDGILILGKDYRFRVANKTFLERTGQTMEKIMNLTPADILPESVMPIINKAIRDVFDGIEVPSHEVEVKTVDKSVITVEINSKLIDYEGDKALLSILRDISERKQFDKKIIDTIIMTEEKERENFAKNLHDEIGPLLSSIKMYITSLESTRVKEKQEFIIRQLKDIMKEAIQSTKEISNDLSPHILSNYGLNAAVDSFINRISHIYVVTYDTNLGNKRFHEMVETSLYRIIKELVNNTLKHSMGTSITITLKYMRGVLRLLYTDNGTGLPQEFFSKKEPSGMGISNIISRVRSLNGHSNFFNNDEGGMGCELRVTIEKNK
jgi:PAS domain S-box-containing protein